MIFRRTCRISNKEASMTHDCRDTGLVVYVRSCLRRTSGMGRQFKYVPHQTGHSCSYFLRGMSSARYRQYSGHRSHCLLNDR